VLETSGPEIEMTASSLLRGWEAAAEEGVQLVVEEEAEQLQVEAAARETAGTGQGGLRLPQLRHLEVKGWIVGFLPTFLRAGVASGLISCKITSAHDIEHDLISLAACSGLQELQLVDSCYQTGPWVGDQLAAEHPLRNSALTKLVLDHCDVGEPALRLLCVATQLRHLDLRRNTGVLALPSDLSSLQQLTFLDVSPGCEWDRVWRSCHSSWGSGCHSCRCWVWRTPR
jgi:hypothetical protein